MAHTSDVMDAFLAGKSRKVGNHRTDGETYYLFDNPIIWREDNTLVVSCAHYPTPTTFSVLNCVTHVDGTQTRNHVDHYSGKGMTLYHDLSICGKPWDGSPYRLARAMLRPGILEVL